MKRIVLHLAALAVASAPLTASAAGESNPLDPESWPRSYKVGDDAIYQSQVSN